MKVLLADDDFIARQIIATIISYEGFECISTQDGTSALEILLEPEPPAVAVLDWQMPGMDGIEIISQLRKKQSVYIYCILLTARSDKEDMITGFSAGADDFLTKPLERTLMRQRLQVARRIMQYEANERELRDELADYAFTMRKLADDRARQLIHADRLATLGTLSTGIAHEINNPASFISGNVQTIEKCWKILLSRMEKDGNYEDDQIRFIKEEFPKMIEGIHFGVKRISGIVSSLKSYARQDISLAKTFFNIDEALNESFKICNNRLKYNVDVRMNCDKSTPVVFGDKNQIEQVLINIITNAADAMDGMKYACLTVECGKEGNFIWVHIQDNGPGIAPEVADKIFDPFFTTKSGQNGTGLGLSIARNIVAAHGGELKFISSVNGTRFSFSVPVSANPTEADS